MKIAVASDDGKAISAHFGRTLGFVICEVEGESIKGSEYRKNTFTGHARGLEGAGHAVDRHGPILQALSDCKVVISHGMGRRIYNDLKTAGIETFITDQTHVQSAVQSYLQGELQDISEAACDHSPPGV